MPTTLVRTGKCSLTLRSYILVTDNIQVNDISSYKATDMYQIWHSYDACTWRYVEF